MEGVSKSHELGSRLASTSGRAAAAAELARHLGAEALLLFVRDREVEAFLPAPGLAQTLPGGPAWRALLRRCENPGDHRAEVAHPDRTSAKPAVAIATSDGLVFALVGGAPRPDEAPRALFPLLAAVLRAEIAAEAARGRENAARAETRQAALVASALDATRAELERTLAEARRLNAELRTADERKDELLAMLAHELRNPLAPIVAAVGLLGSETPRGRSLDRVLGVLERQSRQLTRLVDDLLDVSRFSRGHIELRRAPVAVGEALAQAVESVRPLLESERHELVVEVPESPLHVMADRARLTQVLSNLLTNAGKYTNPGGHLRVAVSAEGQEAVVRVSDDGIGIEPDVLPHVFELFTQGPRALDRSKGGLGIGLTLVKRLMVLHGGAVEARSEGSGKGSEFLIRLPLVSAPDLAAERESTPGSRRRRPLRVLVVEDNRDAADLLSQGLELAGLEVSMELDGARGLDRALTLRPDVVLLDIGLPGMDGFSLARELRARLPGLTVIALSGYGGESVRARAVEAGIDRYFVKPIELDELIAALTASERQPAG